MQISIEDFEKNFPKVIDAMMILRSALESCGVKDSDCKILLERQDHDLFKAYCRHITTSKPGIASAYVEPIENLKPLKIAGHTFEIDPARDWRYRSSDGRGYIFEPEKK
jgi:hypothetical protein